MTILEKIGEDLKNAMRAKDTLKMSVLRMLISESKYAKIQKMKELTDEDMLAVIQKAVKQRDDAATEYASGGRAELQKKELDEKAILQAYLPAQMGEEEVAAVVKKAIEETGATEEKQFGMVAKVVMPQLKWKADSKMVMETIKKMLKK